MLSIATKKGNASDGTHLQLFTFSPFGLGCRQCIRSASIQSDERSIQIHLKKHGMDSRLSTVRSLLEEYKKELLHAKALGSIDPYRSDSKTYAGFSCVCGQSFVKIGNANRHCKTVGCDSSKLQKVDLIKLCCGSNLIIVRQELCFFLFFQKREKQDHTYTHMFTPLIHGCGGGKQFVQKIKSDFSSIHSSPCSSTEFLLVQIHKHAEDWLLKFVQKNILMVPGNLRAGLQTFEGGEIEEISHRCTYTMQHDPRSLLPELKKLLSFSYRRGLFASRGFDTSNAFAVPYFLKDLLLEVPQSVASLPFVAEFCLMFAFRVSTNGSEINMISCDTVSSVFSKISSVLKAAVCSVICSFSNQSFTIFGPALVKSVRESPVIHILSPMVRQIREMHRRMPKRRKTTLDTVGNIMVDQYSFLFDEWSRIVPRTVFLMRDAITELADGLWWEPIVDLATNVKVRVDKDTGGPCSCRYSLSLEARFVLAS
ncbi:hypothetical protein MHU86_11294 [Fragilaria crotonensis]|nr:hypothetical protein MHU86_11294 [Fragilaria crotonensis]